MDGLLLTGVPVAHLIEVQVAHVVTLDLTQARATLEHLTPAIVLLGEGVTIVLVAGSKIIRVISVGNLTRELMRDRTNEHA